MTIINETLRPHSFALATLEVKDIKRNVSIIKFSSSYDLTARVTDPNNTSVKLSHLSHPVSHFAFKPEIAGKYTIHIINNSSKDGYLNAIFGYVPMTIENDQIDVNLLNGIFVGSSLVVSGIIMLIIGIIFVILGRSTRRQPVTS
jgi:hypothetical protein